MPRLPRWEDAKEKKAAIETYRVPGIKGLWSPWVLAEITYEYKIEKEFDNLIKGSIDVKSRTH